MTIYKEVKMGFKADLLKLTYECDVINQWVKRENPQAFIIVKSAKNQKQKKKKCFFIACK